MGNINRVSQMNKPKNKVRIRIVLPAMAKTRSYEGGGVRNEEVKVTKAMC